VGLSALTPTGRRRIIGSTSAALHADEASPAASIGEEVGDRADDEEATSVTSYPGILERRDAQGRSRYRVRVNRNGRSLNATLPTLEAALAWRAQALTAAEGLGEPPEPPTKPQAPAPSAPGRAITIEHAARRLVRGMIDGSVRTRDGRPYKPSVTRKYEEQLRLLVLPRIGAVPISTLTGGDCQRLVDAIAAERTPEHARKALTALRVALRLAQRYGELDANPCAGVTVPVAAEGEKPPRILTPEEAAAIVGACEADDARLERSFAGPLYALAFGTGLRMGELLALRWGPEGLDLDTGVVHVRASLDRVRDGDGDYTPLVPKSRAGRRDVPLAPEDAARMRRHRLATGRPEDGELVFAGDDGEPLSPVPAFRAWKRACRAPNVNEAKRQLERALTTDDAEAIILASAGVAAAKRAPAPRPHDARHAFASHLLAVGLTAHAVAELLGHADAALVTRRYGHALPYELAQAGERLSQWRRSRGI
jgi:integrase